MLRELVNEVILLDSSAYKLMKQISIYLRYILNNEPHEEFLNFKPANELNAQSLFDVILETLPKEGVGIQPCVSQSYDGASVMSGHLSGVRRLMTDMVPGCFYIHCNAHKMNLCIVDCVKGIGQVADFLKFFRDYRY